MCHYNVRKCIRCREVYPLEYELCEEIEHGSICIDKTKLSEKSNSSLVKDTMALSPSTSTMNAKSLTVDLFELLPHKYTYTDGCFNCGG